MNKFHINNLDRPKKGYLLHNKFKSSKGVKFTKRKKVASLLLKSQSKIINWKDNVEWKRVNASAKLQAKILMKNFEQL